MVKNVIDVGIIKKKLLMESKIQNYAKDVQILSILNLLKSSFFDSKRKLRFDLLLYNYLRFLLRALYKV